MTEDEATTKLCHRSFPNGCIASACMAWRWSLEKETSLFLADVQEYARENKVNFNAAASEVWREKVGTYEKTEGYCGLAGKERV